MLAIFRTDASSKIGLGHLMRCLALAQALEKNHIDCIFVVSEATLDIARQRHDWVGRLVAVPQGITALHEAEWLAEFIVEHAPDMVVLDGYHFDHQYRQQLHALDPVLVCFDDTNGFEHLPADVVINGAHNAAELGYTRSAPQAVLCLGAGFRVLRQEFTVAPHTPWPQRQQLTITLGGSDPLDVTLPLLQALDTRKFDGQIRVITGAAYPKTSALEGFIRQSRLAIQHVHNCQHMADMFVQSRLTVSAAGGSQFEILNCESPAILLLVADNQHNATQHSVRQGWCEALDCRESVDPERLANHIVSLWQNGERLQAMHAATQQYADRLGADRVVECILKRVAHGR